MTRLKNENTDLSYISPLEIFIRSIRNNFSVAEEMLHLIPLCTTVMDGARAMIEIEIKLDLGYF